jgi:hypothetical protein
VLEACDLEGFWWLPAVPDRRTPGTLHFSQADIKLALLGGLAEPLEISGGEAGEGGEARREVAVDFGPLVAFQPRILGETRNGKAVTLELCNGRSLATGFPRLTTSEYGPRFVLVGAWYEPEEDVAFDEIAIRFSDLDNWASVSGFATKYVWTEDQKSLASIESTFTPPEDIEVALDDETTLTFEFPYAISGMRPVTTELHITQAATIRIAFAKPANIERSLTYVGVLRNFLALAIGRPIGVLSVRGFHNPPTDAEADPFTGFDPQKLEVEILYRLVGLPEPAERELHPTEMLFTLGQVYPRLPDVLSTWFAKQELLGPVLARYFHLVHTPPTSREQEFENLTRVLETHHRLVAGPAAKTTEHLERLAAILSATPVEHREWLENRLEYSHEPTLSQRLKTALARCPEIAARVVGNSDARSSFARKVSLTRNYETHLDPDKRAEAARGAELVALTYQLRALVEMTLLLEIGFSCEEVATIFERQDARYRQIEALRPQ